MRPFILSLTFLILTCALSAQSKDSAAVARRDSILMAKMLKSAVYPLIKTAPMGGVIPINNPDEKIDPNLHYKLLMEFTQAATKPEKAKEFNGSLVEVARIVNLHIAAGVPRSNLEVVVVTHGSALFSLLDDMHYQKKFKLDNPNAKLVKELQDAGISFVACGQAMKFLDIEKESMLPGIRLAYSAKTAISTYGLKGFVLTDISE